MYAQSITRLKRQVAAVRTGCTQGNGGIGIGLTITVQFTGALGVMFCLLEDPQPQWDKEHPH